MCIDRKHYTTFQLFVPLVLRGGGGRAKRILFKGIKFFIRHQHFDVVPKRGNLLIPAPVSASDSRPLVIRIHIAYCNIKFHVRYILKQ